MQTKTVRLSTIGLTQVSGSISFSQAIWTLNKALFVLLLWGSLIFGLRALGLVLLSITSALLCEVVIVLLRSLKGQSDRLDLQTRLRNETANGSAFLYGFIFGLSLPVTAHWLLAVLGPVIAIALVKWGLGGLGNFWIHPALSARLFLELSWPSGFRSLNWGRNILATSAWNIDAVSGASDIGQIGRFLSENTAGALFRPLSILSREFSNADAFITRFLNENIFIPSGIVLPEGYIDYFLGLRFGAIGETSVLLILLISAFLFARDIIQWQTPLFAILTLMLLSFIFSGVLYGAQPLRGDIIFALVNSGFLFIVFFILIDPNTGVYSHAGKILHGVLFSSLYFVLWEVSWNPHSQTIALLFANCIAQVINYFKLTTTRSRAVKEEHSS